MEDKFLEKQVSSEKIFDGRVVKLYVDEIIDGLGRPAKRELIRHNGGAAVLAIDENGDILFVKQHRYPTSRTFLEIPAGMIEIGEEPAVCGARELIEETGHKAGEFSGLGYFFPSPGYSSECLHLFLASRLSFVGQNLDDDENIDIVRIPFDKAVEMIIAGEIIDGKSVIAILKYKEILSKTSLKKE